MATDYGSVEALPVAERSTAARGSRSIQAKTFAVLGLLAAVALLSTAPATRVDRSQTSLLSIKGHKISILCWKHFFVCPAEDSEDAGEQTYDSNGRPLMDDPAINRAANKSAVNPYPAIPGDQTFEIRA